MVFCTVCHKSIGEREDASYHGNNIYKHRKCFDPYLPYPLYHRREIEFDTTVFPKDETMHRARKIVKRFELFGARVLYYDTSSCIMIYPDDLPERLHIYNDVINKNIHIPTALTGIVGFRNDVIASLPESYTPTDFPPAHLFDLPEMTNNIFVPQRYPKLRGGIIW